MCCTRAGRVYEPRWYDPLAQYCQWCKPVVARKAIEGRLRDLRGEARELRKRLKELKADEESVV